MQVLNTLPALLAIQQLVHNSVQHSIIVWLTIHQVHGIEYETPSCRHHG